MTATELGFWDAITGELELSIPLPVVAIARGKSYINSYNIRGVWMQHPTPLWQRKRNEAEKRFKSIDPGGSSALETCPEGLGWCAHCCGFVCAQPSGIGRAQGYDIECAQRADTLQ